MTKRLSGAAFRREIRPMLRIAGPLVLAEIGWMSMGLVDTVMVGHMPDAAVPLSATALAQILYNAFAFGVGGVLLGLDTTIAQAHGAGEATRDWRAAHGWLYQGVLLSLVLACGLVGFLLLVPFGLRRLPVDATVLREAVPALRGLLWGTVPLLLGFALRRHLQAFNHVRLIAGALVTANLANAFFDWLLIYPHRWGGGYGVVGSSWATSLARCYMAGFYVSALWWVNRRHRYGMLAGGLVRSLRPHWTSLRRVLALGVPSGATILVEILVFAVVTATIATLGPVPLAGHEIALNCISFTFMIPMGISAAASVRVGQAVGRGSVVEARAAGWAAIALGSCAMLCSSVAYLSVPQGIAGLFTADTAVIAAAVPLFAIAAVFQFCDGLQVTAIGALRGTGDTRSGLIVHLCSYWLLGLPVGMWLCFGRGMGARGLWMGLSVALVVSGLVLVGRWWGKRILVGGV